MSAIFTLQYGTYSFPNQTFEIEGHSLYSDTPVNPIRRKDGGVELQGFLQPKRFTIRGKVYSSDPGTVHNDLINLKRAVHNQGNAANFRYKDDRYVPGARMAPEGIQAIKAQGLFGYLYEVSLVFVAERPFAESDTLRHVSGTRNNASSGETLTNNGNYPTNPLFIFVAGTQAFNNKLRVDNLNNSMFFAWGGPFAAGQTLIVDCDGGCVLLQVGLTLVDAISWFSGNLFFRLEDGGSNSLIINGGTFAYDIYNRDRYYA